MAGYRKPYIMILQSNKYQNPSSASNSDGLNGLETSGPWLEIWLLGLAFPTKKLLFFCLLFARFVHSIGNNGHQWTLRMSSSGHTFAALPLSKASLIGPFETTMSHEQTKTWIVESDSISSTSMPWPKTIEQDMTPWSAPFWPLWLGMTSKTWD